MRVPSERASSIQILFTCNALAKNAIVHLFVWKWYPNLSENDIFSFYGLKNNFKIHQLSGVKSRSKLWKFAYSINTILKMLKNALIERFCFRRTVIIYTRDPFFAFFLVLMRPILRIPVIYEAHLIESEILEKYQSYLGKFHSRKLSVKPSTLKRYRKKLMEEFVLGNVNGLIAITESIKKALLERSISDKKVAVIRDGFDISRFDLSLKKQDALKRLNLPFSVDMPILIYTGHLYPWKGVSTLVNAMPFVVDKIKQIKLLIVGGTPHEYDLQQMKKLASKVQISNSIFFTGYFPPTQIPLYLKASDIAIIPLTDTKIGRYYTSPLKLFEYMGASVPIIASNLDSLAEILEDGKTAVLVEAENPVSLANGILKLLKNPEKAKELSENAYRLSKQYSWDERAKNIIKFIKQFYSS